MQSIGCISGPGTSSVWPWRQTHGVCGPASGAGPLPRHAVQQHWLLTPHNDAPSAIVCLAAAASTAAGEDVKRKAPVKPQPKQPVGDIKEAHKVFDEAVIIVKSGDGGQGEVVESDKGRWVPNLKYKPGGNQAKKIWLNASEPAEGADGADVVIVCDPGLDNLLHLHARKQFTAPRGSNANPAAGSGGPKNNRDGRKAVTRPFEIPVPPGTVVKRKGTGTLLGEIINPGDRLVVVCGGRGGTGVVVPSRKQKIDRQQKQTARAQREGTEVIEVEDRNWKADAAGAPGQQLSLSLLLRVVADVGIVGLPNAGKSSLLRSMTNASPAIAPYPFTTLMPNLGVLAAGGAHKTVLADLPGLIEGAHEGKGLGRMFLRHLRRTRSLLHVVDASLPDPVRDYVTVREELRMYNPDYCARPHVVVLNKIDLLESESEAQALVAGLMDAASQHCSQWSREEVVPLPPAAVVTASAATGHGLGELNKALAHSLRPGCAKELATRGPAATLRLVSPALPTPGSGAPGSTPGGDPAGQSVVVAGGVDAAERAASRTLEYFNSKVQGAEAWSGAHIIAGQQGTTTANNNPSQQQQHTSAAGDDDDEGEDDAPPGPLDVEDAWLFDLTDSQLYKLADQDEARASGRERVIAAATGGDPYAAATEDLVRGDAAGTAARTAAGAREAMAAAVAVAEAAAVAAAAAAGAGEEAGAGVGTAVEEAAGEEGEGKGEGEDEDEWVELTEEEMELLEFLDEHEAAEAEEEEEEAQGDGMAGPLTGEAAEQRPGRPGGTVDEESDAETDAQVNRLCELSDAELEAMAEGGGDSWGCEADGMAGAVGGDPEEGGEGGVDAEQGVVEEEDQWLFELSEDALEELALRADQAWAERLGE